MYCRSCGSKLEDGKAFCGNCGTPVQPESAAKAPSETPASADDAKKNRIGNRFCIISMLLLFVPSGIMIPLAVTRAADAYFTAATAMIVALAYLFTVILAYGLMLIARAQYATKLSKVMMVIYTIIFVLAVVFGGIFMIFAVIDCGSDFVECVHHF